MLNTYSDGDVLSAAELNSDNTEINTRLNVANNDVEIIGNMINTAGASGYGILKWTDIRWQNTGGLTTDAGVTWTGGTGYGTSNVADTDGSTFGIAVNFTAGASKYSNDSGDTWTAATTSPANVNSNGVKLIQVIDSSNLIIKCPLTPLC